MTRRRSFQERYPRLFNAFWILVLVYIIGGAICGGIAFWRMS